jgi:putative transposase
MNRHRCAIAVLCRKLGVSRGGYYAWVKRKQSQRAQDNASLLVAIKHVHEQSEGRYGYPRIHAELSRQGLRCGKHRVARIMRENGIIGRKATRYRRHRFRSYIYDDSRNLLRGHEPVTGTNQVWVGDITYIRIKGGWSYLSIVMDLYSRKIIGWTFSKQRSAQLVCESLIMAVNDNEVTDELIFHSDQGSEYASKEYVNTLKMHGIRMSMSRRGHCWDNAHMESFFHTLKTEMIYFQYFKSIEEAMAYIVDYIYFYNHNRIYSSLCYQTPVEFEQQAA